MVNCTTWNTETGLCLQQTGELNSVDSVCNFLSLLLKRLASIDGKGNISFKLDHSKVRREFILNSEGNSARAGDKFEDWYEYNMNRMM